MAAELSDANRANVDALREAVKDEASSCRYTFNMRIGASFLAHALL